MEGSETEEAPVAVAIFKSGAAGLIPSEEFAGAGAASAGAAVLCESRFDAVVSEEVRFVVAGDASEARFVELRRVDELTVCTGCNGHLWPGQPGPGEIDEAEQVTPKSSAAATAT